MTKIRVEGDTATVTLSEPDDDGEYLWSCECGSESDRWETTADAIASAEVHLEHHCPGANR
jgi:hypothetical protein